MKLLVHLRHPKTTFIDKTPCIVLGTHLDVRIHSNNMRLYCISKVQWNHK
jgi:hypothetical protein